MALTIPTGGSSRPQRRGRWLEQGGDNGSSSTPGWTACPGCWRRPDFKAAPPSLSH